MSDEDPVLHVISFDTCPYVERTRIVLGEKELDYKITFIDLGNKPDWFLKISPRGKVPVLLVDERPIFESSVINEFLDEAFPEPPMFPDDALLRAQERAWIVYANDVLLPAFGDMWFSKAGQDEKVDDAKKRIVEGISKVETYLENRENGPYFSGADFGLVDAVYAPLFSRRDASHEVFGDLESDFPHWNKYGDALLERDTVQEAQAENLTDKFVTSMRKRLAS